MNSKKVMGFSAAALCIGLAVPCFGDVVSVDETTCISGSASVPCTTPSTLTDLQTSFTTFNYVFTLPDHDNFLIYGSTGWENYGSRQFGFYDNIGAQYLGNAMTGSVPSQAETIRVDDSQFVNLDGSNGGTFNESDTIYFNGPIGAGSQATAYTSVDGQPLPTMTFSPSSGSQSYSNVPLSGLTEPFLIDWTQTFSFAAGSQPGAAITFNPVPEPGSFSLALLVALGLAGNLVLRNRRSKTC
ncbi:MAG: PEP-CTERM sorting domain-containing protein [Steroidobacteraceae bacterium]